MTTQIMQPKLLRQSSFGICNSLKEEREPFNKGKFHAMAREYENIGQVSTIVWVFVVDLSVYNNNVKKENVKQEEIFCK